MSGEVWRSKDGAVELRLGRWQDVLADVECDSLITDPPYSERTEKGQPANRRDIEYGKIQEDDANDLALWTNCHVNRWAVVFNDHIGWRWYESAFINVGWYTFAPVVWCKGAAAPRMSADGPCTAVEHILVARTRNRLNGDEMGSRPGFYLGCRAVLGAMSNGAVLVGAKPLQLMQEIVSDYSRPGDLICDPCAGGATTLLAAAIEGRRAIGAEMDPETYLKAVHRLEKGWTPTMRFDAGPEMKQAGLL